MKKRKFRESTITVILLMAMVCVAGCNKTFFTLDALIIDDITRKPVPGAKVILAPNESHDELKKLSLSNDNGRVGFFMNKPKKTPVTLLVEKEGYHPGSLQFEAAPLNTVIIRLVPYNEKENLASKPAQ